MGGREGGKSSRQVTRCEPTEQNLNVIVELSDPSFVGVPTAHLKLESGKRPPVSQCNIHTGGGSATNDFINDFIKER
ncbi:MAG TPA: hypothetical protein VGG58_06990 [Candidatus Acidoferrum sp.]|jgi:hypothetical protein